ncbi:MAG: hypothetical protein LLH30_02880 [Candidatus Manganitrophus sp. SA1]|nr:hypothetical protein [Candidatus Manganitrophus morganii]
MPVSPPSRTRPNPKVSVRLTALFLGILFSVLVVEGVFRLLPVAKGPTAGPITAEHPIFRFMPNSEYQWSVGWRFSLVNHGRTNNAGFVNDQDYDAKDPRPLLAVIGDSYVEALMLPYPETLQGRVQKFLGGQGRVYSFAASGAPLSQYLAWADDARARYAPQGMIFVVVGNDFDESVAKYKTAPGFHHFIEKNDGGLSLQLYDYAPTLLRKTLRHSALARYLVSNLHADTALKMLWQRLMRSTPAGETERYVGNTAADVADDRLRDSERAIRAFFDELPRRTALPPGRILFLLDGVRPELYGSEEDLDAVNGAYFPHMRRRFMEEARNRGYSVADLQPLFIADYRENGARFEFSEDGHWNALGHQVASEAIMRSRLFKALFTNIGKPLN